MASCFSGFQERLEWMFAGDGVAVCFFLRLIVGCSLVVCWLDSYVLDT
jgi:hypothetical protein